MYKTIILFLEVIESLKFFWSDSLYSYELYLNFSVVSITKQVFTLAKLI